MMNGLCHVIGINDGDQEVEVKVEFLNELSAKKVIVNDRRVIVLWNDDTKTMTTCAEDDEFSIYTGIMSCYLKRILGTKMFHAKMDRAMKKVDVIKMPKAKKAAESTKAASAQKATGSTKKTNKK